MISLRQYGYDIQGLRNGYGTYDLYDVPDIKDIITLTGDYSWAPLDASNSSGKQIVIKKNAWETFRDNPVLHEIVKSPTASYVQISELDKDSNLIIFFRDQQDCIVWAVNPDTGYVYASTEWDLPIARSVEEFWCRQWIESVLWYRSSGYLNLYGKFFELEHGDKKDAKSAQIMRKYEAYYLNKKPDWIAKDLVSQWIFNKPYDGTDIGEIKQMKELVKLIPLTGGTDASVFKGFLKDMQKEFIVRLFPEHQTDESVAREVAITKLVGEAMIGPRVFYVDSDGSNSDSGFGSGPNSGSGSGATPDKFRPRGMIMEFIKNRDAESSDSLDSSDDEEEHNNLIISIANQVKNLHQNEDIAGRFRLGYNRQYKCYLSSFFHEVMDLFQKSRKSIIPDFIFEQILEILKEADKVLEAMEEKDLVLCHNDLHQLNMLLDSSKRIFFIDWTYAGIGPRQFDLAYVETMMQFEEEDRALFGKTYGLSYENGKNQWISLVWTFWMFWGLQTLYHKIINDNEMFSDKNQVFFYFEKELKQVAKIDKCDSYIDQLRAGELSLKGYNELVEFIVQCLKKRSHTI